MLVRHGASIAVCGTCIDARGIADTDLVTGALRGSMAMLAEWTGWSDKVIVY
ncbi:MAG: DsrE family protein [Burkholderiales bacterium]|nr:DsrE family protein [Burkholderiales bacterium]